MSKGEGPMDQELLYLFSSPSSLLLLNMSAWLTDGLMRIELRWMVVIVRGTVINSRIRICIVCNETADTH